MSNIQTISGHVLLPHQADWTRPPKVERLWRSEVAASMGGAEDRVSARSTAWVKMSYEVLPYNQVEKWRFEERFKAGIRAGKIAVPYWGKGVALSEEAPAGGQQLNLVRSTHGITSGKYVVVQTSKSADFDQFDLCLVQSVSGARLNIAAALAYTHPEGARVWTVLCGRPLPQPYQVLNSTRSRHTVVVQFDGRQINAQAFDDFSDYALGLVASPLDGGEGWDGAWVLGNAA